MIAKYSHKFAKIESNEPVLDFMDKLGAYLSRVDRIK